jgi:preprotein translocase subunit SecA
MDLKEQVLQYAERTMDEIVEAYVDPELPPEEWDLEKLVAKVKEFVYLLEGMEAADLADMTIPEIKQFLHEEVRTAYDRKEQEVDKTRPGLMRDAERYFILQQIDTLWREHLQAMESLRESIGLRGYGQKDPLIEYNSIIYNQLDKIRIYSPSLHYYTIDSSVDTMVTASLEMIYQHSNSKDSTIPPLFLCIPITVSDSSSTSSSINEFTSDLNF